MNQAVSKVVYFGELGLFSTKTHNEVVSGGYGSEGGSATISPS